MRLADSAVNKVRFGVFEVDVRNREVRKTGKSVHLQEQPYRILEVLLRNPGQTVTREQFRREIWGDDVYVDFDRSLNTGVARLREALGDSPTRPTYIETVPRIGYRFIAPIESPGEESPVDERARGDSAHPSPRPGWRVIPLVAMPLLAIGVAWLYWGLSVIPESPASAP